MCPYSQSMTIHAAVVIIALLLSSNITFTNATNATTTTTAATATCQSLDASHALIHLCSGVVTYPFYVSREESLSSLNERAIAMVPTAVKGKISLAHSPNH